MLRVMFEKGPFGRWLCVLCTAFCLFTVGVPSSAQADARDDEARALFLKGIEATDAQHWAEAVDAFRRSLALVERASTRFNLITALYRQGEYREAMKAAEPYMAANYPNKDTAKRAEVEKLLAEMRATMGSLRIDLEPRHAQVRVSGELLPENRSRHELALPPGVHEVIVSADGYAPRIESVTVEKGVRTLVSMKLVPAGAAVATPPVAAAQPTQAVSPDLLEARRQNDLRLRILELDRQVARLEEAIQGANNKKPLVMLGLGTAFIIGGAVAISSGEDATPVVVGAAFVITGGVLIISSAVSGLVRRSKRSYYQRRIERYKKDKEGLEVQLTASLTPTRQWAGLQLRF